MKYMSAIFALFFLCLSVNESGAELTINSAAPSLGVMGQELQVTVKGKGFDEDTRVSIAADSGNRSSIIGSLDTFENPLSVTVVDNLAYVADWGSGLQVVDVSDPTAPSVFSSVDTPGEATSITVNGSNAYIADNESGLQIIDISNPSAPSIIGTFDTPGRAQSVAVSENTAYIADWPSNLQIIDVTDPTAPSFVRAIEIPGFAMSVEVIDDIGYVANENGLLLIDLKHSTSSKIIGFVDTPGSAHSVVVVGNFAYVADMNGGLQIIDVSDPEAPVITGSLITPGQAWSVTVIDTVAYVADLQNGLQVIDASNPTDPQNLGSIDTPGWAASAFVSGTTAYVADQNHGLQIINVSRPVKPTVIGTVDTPGWAESHTIINDIAYVADFDSGIQVIDISDPKKPTNIGSVNTPGHALSVSVENSTAYVADRSEGLQVIDVSNPAEPTIVASVDTPGFASAVAVNDGKAYVADYDGGLQIIDVSNPAEPYIVSSLPLQGYAGCVEIVGTMAYVADVGLYLIDVSDAESPRIIGSSDTPGFAKSVDVWENKAYVVDWDEELHVIDVSDASTPEIIGSITTPGWAESVTVVGATAYVADWYTGIQIIDVSNPVSPTIIGSLDTFGDAKTVSIIAQMAFVTDAEAGLTIIPLPEEIHLPNVFDSNTMIFTIPSPQIPGHYTLRVFNNNGESDELTGAVTFVESGSRILEKKAVIVAGKGPGEDRVWNETMRVADHAYEMLKVQGYTDDRIQYLSADTDTGNVDEAATVSMASSAIREWAQDASDLLIYFVGHGQRGTFNVNPSETLSVQSLSEWFEEIQANLPGKLVFIYEACMSGTFIPVLSQATHDRVIVTSGSDEYSWFANNGVMSFSFMFWSVLSTDMNLNDAYNAGRELMLPYNQTALLDGDGDGRADEPEDKTIAANTRIGREYMGEVAKPYIGDVAPPQILTDGEAAAIWVDGLVPGEGAIDSVSANILSPDDVSQSQVIEIDLVETDGRYEALYTGFALSGTYTVHILVRDAGGGLAAAQTSVTQTAGDGAMTSDVFENDDKAGSATVVLVDESDLQPHTFHDPADTDWAKFFALSGQVYKIRTANPAAVCDPVIELFDVDGMTLLKTRNNRGPGSEEALDWRCESDGVYYIKILDANPNIFGMTIQYGLEIYRPHLSDAGAIIGKVTDASGNPLSGARIKTSNGSANLSQSDGGYLIKSPPGSFTLIAEADGYGRYEKTVTLDQAQILQEDITIGIAGDLEKGDINGDGDVNLRDLVLVLQVMAGVEDLLQAVHSAAEVDGDDDIGLEEAVYIMRSLSAI